MRSVFLAVKASLRLLNNVSGVYLVQVILLLIGPQCLGDIFMYRPLLLIGWWILRQRRRKTINLGPKILSAMQAASQPNFINEQLYSTCD